MVKIIQGNMNRSKTADHLLQQLAAENGAELILISEQYTNKSSPRWYTDHLGTAAIWNPNGREHVKNHGAGRGYVWVKCKEATFFSCYFTPNEAMAEYRAKLEELEDEILNTTGPIVVGGDFNARALEWGMPHPDSRGRCILEMAARTGLLVLNVGETTTFRRPGYTETIPDITLASEALIPHISGWAVMEDYCGSDHQYISFVVGNRQQVAPEDKPGYWNLNRLNVRMFEATLATGIQRRDTEGGTEAEALVSSTIDLVNSACEVSMPRKKPRHGKSPVYWWTPEIADLRKRCLTLRRIAQRAINRVDANQKMTVYKLAKRQLRRSINFSRVNCWKKLIKDIDEDPWGLGYKLVTKKLGAQSQVNKMNASTMNRIVRTLFPSHAERIKQTFERDLYVPLFSEQELESAIYTLKKKKAPGPDGLPGEVLKMVFRFDPQILLQMYNSCLSEGVFSARWKIARLVLINKGKGDPELPSSYRPLCMLDTAGKVLEKLIKARLARAIKDAGDLSPRQYGFRSGLSTIDAVKEVIEAVRRAENFNHFSRRIVLLVTLDVKNAFNSVRWSDILEALEHRFNVPMYLLRILNNYFEDRTLRYDTEEGWKTMVITSGAAQGSILGPDLWNAFYDSLLRIEMPDESRLVGYADDVAVLIAARDTKQAQLKLNQTMRRVNSWMAAHGLSLALSKTEIAILTKKRINTEIPMWVSEEVIQTKASVKYLGIAIDSKTSFSEQIRLTADKAAKGVTALSRLMANTVGPKSSKRRLLMSAVQSVLLYGAEVWADSLNKEMYRKRLAQVQRRGALRVASAYRTVSEAAVLVIAGCIPIELLAMERKAVYERKTMVGKKIASREERCHTMERWQADWQRETKGRWTARLIADIRPWMERRHGEIDYYLTQFLSGHGYFRKYLNKMGKATSEECMYCPDIKDDAEHTFFKCENWAQQRGVVMEALGTWSPETTIEKMVGDEDAWREVGKFVVNVLKKKKDDLDRSGT